MKFIFRFAFTGQVLLLMIAFSLLLSARAQDNPPPAAMEHPEYAVNARGRISTRGLVAAWRGDGNASDRKGASTGTVRGSTTYSPAMVGRGFYFHGTEDAVSIPDTEPLKLTESLTISAWVSIEAFPTDQEHSSMILFRGDDSPGLDPYYVEVNTQKEVRFVINDANGGVASVGAPIAAGRFVLVAATLDHTGGKMRLYENGHLVAEVKTKITPLRDLEAGQNPGLGIGNHASLPNSRFRYPFHGVINELLVYDRALAGREVKDIYEDRTDLPAQLRR